MKYFPQRVLIAGAVATSLLLSIPARAEELVVGIFGGSFAEDSKACHIGEFEKKTGAKVALKLGSSAQFAAGIRATGGKSDFDVVYIDNSLATQLKNEKLLETIDRSQLSNAKEISPRAFDKDNQYVVFMTGATVLVYDTRQVKTPPTSWNDLKDPKYKKLLVIPPLNNTYGLHTLVMMARINGGGESNIDPGFKVVTNEIAPNVLVFEPSPGKMTELFESGQGVIAVWGSGRVSSFAATGFPVDFVYPKEGAPALLASACPVAKPNASPLAQEFVRMLIEPQFQEIFAKEYGYGPVNRRAQVAPEAARMAPIGKRAEELIVVDWDTINQKRTDWDKRWNREVER